MGTKFPTINYRQITKIAKKLGFSFYRQAKGSHEIWRRDVDRRQTTIPNHGKKDIKSRTVKAIIEDFGISVKEFRKLREKKY